MFKGISRTTKYVILICVFLFTVNLILSAVLIRQSTKALRTQIESRMLDISNTAAAMLDGDELARLEEYDKDSPAYQHVLKTLAYFQDNMDLAYIYCLRDMGNNRFIFTIDPSDDPADFGEQIVTTDELIRASKGTPSVDKKPYTDRWGKFYSAYTPVYDSAGNIAGLVAVDFSAPWYENQIRSQGWTTIVVGGLSLLFASAIVILLASRFRRRFRQLMDDMNAVSDGIETLVHEIRPNAETPRRPEGKMEYNDEFVALDSRIRALEAELSEQIAFVQSQAFVDGLTGLGNRAAYEEHIKRLDDEIRDGQASFSLVLLDLNRLKQINDSRGHEQGDKAIECVAAALQKAFFGASLYRIGGDEFVAIIEAPCPDAEERLAALNEKLEKNEASVASGYAVYEPGNDLRYRTVFNRADAAMYADKREYYQTHGDRRGQVE